MENLPLEISMINTDILNKLADVCKIIVADDRVPIEHKHAMREVLDEIGLRRGDRTKVFYECDGLACEECNKKSGGFCHHTSDIRHAKNFRQKHHGASYRETVRVQEG